MPARIQLGTGFVQSCKTHCLKLHALTLSIFMKENIYTSATMENGHKLYRHLDNILTYLHVHCSLHDVSFKYSWVKCMFHSRWKQRIVFFLITNYNSLCTVKCEPDKNGVVKMKSGGRKKKTLQTWNDIELLSLSANKGNVMRIQRTTFKRIQCTQNIQVHLLGFDAIQMLAVVNPMPSHISTLSIPVLP